jgi:hypothetical protein
LASYDLQFLPLFVLSLSEPTPKRSKKRDPTSTSRQVKRSRLGKSDLLANIGDLLELSERQQTQEQLWKMYDEEITENEISDGDDVLMEAKDKRGNKNRKGIKGSINQPTVLEEYVERPAEERGKKFRKQRIKGNSVDKGSDDAAIEYVPNKLEGKRLTFDKLYKLLIHFRWVKMDHVLSDDPLLNRFATTINAHCHRTTFYISLCFTIVPLYTQLYTSPSIFRSRSPSLTQHYLF